MIRELCPLGCLLFSSSPVISGTGIDVWPQKA